MKFKYYVIFGALSISVSSATISSQAQVITTVAGNGTSGYSPDGAAATASAFNFSGVNPCVIFDPAGNMYFTEPGNSIVRKVNTSGVTATIIGQHGVVSYNGDGIPASNATLSNPAGLAIDAAGNIYIADYGNSRVRMVNTAGIITTIAGTGTPGYSGDGGAATNAQISAPVAIAIDGSGNIFISDRGNMNVRKVNTSGTISLVAGTGNITYNGDNIPATAANLNHPRGLAFDATGSLYICEGGGNRIRKVDNTGIITTVAGDGNSTPLGGEAVLATTATVADPFGIVFDFKGNYYVACEYDNRVREVNTTNVINTVAGTGVSGYNGDGGIATLSQLCNSESVAISAGGLFIIDACNNRIRRVGLTIAGVKNISGSISGIDITPNPTGGSFTFNISSDMEEPAQVVITSVLGEKVKEITATTNKPVQVMLDAAPGIYFINAVIPGSGYVAKVVVR